MVPRKRRPYGLQQDTESGEEEADTCPQMWASTVGPYRYSDMSCFPHHCFTTTITTTHQHRTGKESGNLRILGKRSRGRVVTMNPETSERWICPPPPLLSPSEKKIKFKNSSQQNHSEAGEYTAMGQIQDYINAEVLENKAFIWWRQWRKILKGDDSLDCSLRRYVAPAIPLFQEAFSTADFK